MIRPPLVYLAALVTGAAVPFLHVVLGASLVAIAVALFA
jgi:hypothetical protein